MRLNRFITEGTSTKQWEDLSSTLEKDCKPFILEIKGMKSLLYRGSSKDTSFYTKIKQRQDREPLYNDPDLSGMMDEWTNQYWGFKARSQSTFTTANVDVAKGYGRGAYIVFPIGKYRYAWNKDVSNLYALYDSFDAQVISEYDKMGGYDDEEITMMDAKEMVYKNLILPELKKYRTSNLNKYLKMGPWSSSDFTECIINAKSYYLINRVWEPTLLAWYSDRYWRQ